MGKFRSKLKRKDGGKTWSRGHSATSNPETMKHRQKAKSRFFQTNLSLVPQDVEKTKGLLTTEALWQHDARQFYGNNQKEPTVNDIAASMKSVNINQDDDELMSESQLGGTFKTFKTFASDFSSCSNISFKKLLNSFNDNSELHKEMLAILTALTDIIKERGGTQSSTEYFLLLIETIEASKEENETIASISLLSMGIKSVPEAVLRKKFSATMELLMENLQKFMESNHKFIIKNIIGCISVLCRAQDYSAWTYSSNLQYIDAILAFTVHSKPKIRKAAQHAIISILCASSFMLEKGVVNGDISPNKFAEQAIKYHPAASRVAKFCVNQFKPEIIATSQTIVLHTLGLLCETIKTMKSDDIRIICENLLSIMTAANILLRTKCFQVLHSLFTSRTPNLNGILCGKLITAIFDYRPDKSDVRQTLAWLMVLKDGHCHLMKLDTTICLNSLPRFIDVCTTELWMSERTELVNQVSITIKDVLYECVKPICHSTDDNKQSMIMKYKDQIEKIIKLITKAINTPFGELAKYVILTCGILYESVGAHFSDALKESLIILGNRYDPKNLVAHIEHAVQAAVTYIGPENVLKAIPLTDKKNEIILDRSWLLPILREGTNGATLKFFSDYILKLAKDCNDKWNEYKIQEKIALSHTYELLCCQLWGLFPGFCRNPSDIENFSLIARTLGNALKNNPGFRAPVLDGLNELINNESCQKELTKFAKNFLPILLNLYTEKPKGTYEIELRKNVLNVIKSYLSITPEALCQQLFARAFTEIMSLPAGGFESDGLLEILYALLIYQPEEQLKEFFKTFVTPILKSGNAKHVAKDKEKLKKQQRKSYELLYNILTEEKESYKKFSKKYQNNIQKLLIDVLNTTCPACQALRLKCFKILIENRKNITVKDELIIKSTSEALITFKDFSTKKENVAQELLLIIGNLYQKENKLNDFIDIIMAGFGGDEVLITNTILALRSIIQNLTGHITVSTMEFLLQQVMVFLVQKNRQHAESSVIFLITFVKVLPIPLIANHLENIMKSLSAMVPDTKRYCRIHLGYLLKKLCKKFSADDLIKFVPGDDEVTHKRLKKIRKLLRRENRKKQEEQNRAADEDDESDDNFVEGLEKKSLTIDDILADSDSDLPDDYEDENDNTIVSKKGGKKRKTSKAKESFIQEDPEEIVDLADVKSIGHIITDRTPAENKILVENKKSKDSNRGFKVAEDGRLIISDKLMNDSSDDSDNDEDSVENNKVKQNGKSKKRLLEESSSDDDEKMPDVHKRKKISDKSTIASRKSGISNATTSRYTAGGKGIHRPLDTSVSTKSVKSGKSGASFGFEYKSSKAKGDMKRKGKVDPYAYIPLNRNILNKRKRAKSAGQFKNIVKGARKGVLKGVKNKIHKKYKK